MKALNKGDAVLLTLDGASDPINLSSVGITPHMRKYRDRQFKISKVKVFGGVALYELEGFVSEKGVPYTVTPDYITPIRPLRR